MEVALSVGKMNFIPAVIFVTAFEGFAVEAFDLAAMDYLLKPVSFERLVRAIDRVLALTRTDDPRPALHQSQWAEEFWVPHKADLVRIPVTQIERIEAERDSQTLFVGDSPDLLPQEISS